jgi:hypothetical protein
MSTFSMSFEYAVFRWNIFGLLEAWENEVNNLNFIHCACVFCFFAWAIVVKFSNHFLKGCLCELILGICLFHELKHENSSLVFVKRSWLICIVFVPDLVDGINSMHFAQIPSGDDISRGCVVSLHLIFLCNLNWL